MNIYIYKDYNLICHVKIPLYISIVSTYIFHAIDLSIALVQVLVLI